MPKIGSRKIPIKIQLSSGKLKNGARFRLILVENKDLGTKIFLLSKLNTTTGLGEFIDDVPLGGNEYYTNETVTGTLEILRLDEHVIAGTFDIHLQNPNTGKTIHLTDGRFDIKQ